MIATSLIYGCNADIERLVRPDGKYKIETLDLSIKQTLCFERPIHFNLGHDFFLLITLETVTLKLSITI